MRIRVRRLVALAWLVPLAAVAQPDPSPEPTAQAEARAATASAPARLHAEPAPPGEAFTLRFGNRPIVVLRARLGGRIPQDRAQARERRIGELARVHPDGPVAWELRDGVGMVTIAGEEALALREEDVDPLEGTLETTTREAAENLRRALAEVAEAHSPRLLARGGVRALGATLVALMLGLLLFWVRERAIRRFSTAIETGVLRRVQQRTRSDLWQMTEATLVGLVRMLGRLLVVLLAVGLAWAWLGFVLRQFPYTRPWGEAMRGFVIATVAQLGWGILGAVPGLFTVALIVLLTRLVVRVTHGLFDAAAQGRLALPGVYPDTAQPTRRLVVALLWLFAVVVAYPYLPGSGSDAFKGVSVFVGLMLSLGSSGLVNQAMSSFMLTYGRAFKVGDFVRIGDIEGTVVHSGPLATKVLTKRNEEVTIPNAVVTATTIVNYSRHLDEGVFLRATVTIGYAAPWRQVHALLLEAASRTAGVRVQPAPRVFQAGLANFYVEYALLVALERSDERVKVLSELHGHIQDAFNEHGVQIMSPNYEADPEAPKLVPKDRWFAPPARPDSGG